MLPKAAQLWLQGQFRSFLSLSACFGYSGATIWRTGNRG